jgi:TatD DNase family protein
MIVDIAVNITDEMYKGRYNGRTKHSEDIDNVIGRSLSNNILPLFVGLDYESSKVCLSLAGKYNTLCYVGVHPTSATRNKSDVDLIQSLLGDRVIAVGECGLDYYRTEYSRISDQKEVFIKQLEMRYEKYFLHSRKCHRDFMEIIGDYHVSGVVHSFDGEYDEARDLIQKGLFIGINGCSLKNERNVEVVRSVPLDKMVVGTDSPYCSVRKSSKSYKFIKTTFNETKRYDAESLVRGRNEPCNVTQIVEIISELKNMDCNDVTRILYENTASLFGEKLRNVVKMHEAGHSMGDNKDPSA